ncbi:AAA family ATPase [Rossellomorea sp. NPDC071047]|uniref:AAA family ATPase n=1 Tax=Rossellomorea sp. NPDC071047 TaxID=3390675 RepID=UPI003D0044DC
MIIGIISSNAQYKELMSEQEEIELALLTEKPGNETVDFNAILIDGKLIPYRELELIREKYADIPIFYIIHDAKTEMVIQTIQRICASQKVTPINEYYTESQVIEEVMEHLLAKKNTKKKRVITFFGTHSSAGVSTTTLNVARSLSSRVHERILVLSLNAWDPSDYFYDYKGHYLSDLKVDLKTESLTQARLTSSLHQYKNFYHLAGNRDIKMQRYYKPKEIEHLLSVAKENFDLIIVDGGTHFDTAIAAQAYVSSDMRFIVTNQEEKGYRGYFPYVFQQMLEPVGGKREDFMLIINRFQPNMSLISEKDLEEDLEMSRIATIPDMGPIGSIAIRQSKLLYELGEQAYKKPIDTISNLLIAEAGLSEKPIDEFQPKTKGFFSFLPKKDRGGEKVW